MLHVQAAWDEELIGGAIPIDASELETLAGGVDNIAAARTQGKVVGFDARLIDWGEEWSLSEEAGASVGHPRVRDPRIGTPEVAEEGDDDEDGEVEKHGSTGGTGGLEGVLRTRF